MTKRIKLAVNADFIEVDVQSLCKTSNVIRHLFEDLGDCENEETIPLPFLADTYSLTLFYHKVWPQWSDEVHKFDFRQLPKEEFNKTMAEWAQQPSQFLLDFEQLTPKEQVCLGRLGYQLDIPFLETLFMLAVVRRAQTCDSIVDWRPFVEAATGTEFGPEQQEEAVLKAASCFPFLAPPLQSSESCEAPPPHTGVKRRASEC